MAKKKSDNKDVVSATLPSGTKVTASQEVIDKLTGNQKAPARKTASASSDSK